MAARKHSKVKRRMISHINAALEASLNQTGRLADAMRYALLGEGKRLRPSLVLSIARLCETDSDESRAMPAAVAVEYIHAYSLIHDDLPALDNDNMRRGKPSCHKQFDEATAILAGDALLSDAFRILSMCGNVQMCAELATAIGSHGMVAGQMTDMMGVSNLSEAEILKMHSLKTARLFECASVLGAMAVNASEEKIKLARRYGFAYGLAFQLADDLGDESPELNLIGRERVIELKNMYMREAQSFLDYLNKCAKNPNSL